MKKLKKEAEIKEEDRCEHPVCENKAEFKAGDETSSVGAPMKFCKECRDFYKNDFPKGTFKKI